MSWLTIMFLLIASIYLMRLANVFDGIERQQRREAKVLDRLARLADAEDAAFNAWFAAETARLSREVDAIVRPFEEWEAQERMKTIDLTAIDLDKAGRR